MTTIESNLDTFRPVEQVFESYPAVYGDQQVLVIGASDFRSKAAIAIEKFNMMLLGDPESLVDVDLAKDLDNARFLTLFPSDEVPGSDNMLGVVRVTDMDSDTKTLRTFREVSEVTGDSYETIFGHFIEQTDQQDPRKIFDINTYGMSSKVWDEAGAGNTDLFQATKYNLMFAMTHEGVRLHRESGVTHGIAYFNADSWNYFLHKGYDWKQLNGYSPVKDKIVSESGEITEGQPLIPTVLDIAEHLERMKSATTQHLGELATNFF